MMISRAAQHTSLPRTREKVAATQATALDYDYFDATFSRASLLSALRHKNGYEDAIPRHANVSRWPSAAGACELRQCGELGHGDDIYAFSPAYSLYDAATAIPRTIRPAKITGSSMTERKEGRDMIFSRRQSAKRDEPAEWKLQKCRHARLDASRQAEYKTSCHASDGACNISRFTSRAQRAVLLPSCRRQVKTIIIIAQAR